MDRNFRNLLIISAVVSLVLAVLLYFAFRNDTALLEYTGAVYGGLLTVWGIIITIMHENNRAQAEKKRMYESEYRPQIKLTLSEHQYDFYETTRKIGQIGYHIYFGSVKTKEEWQQVSGVIPLQIQNVGSSDVKIEKMEFALTTSDEDGEKTLRTEQYQYSKPARESFTVYSQESFDAPVKLLLPANKFKVTITYRAIIGMDKNSQTECHTKTYWVYAPSRQPWKQDQPILPYREWLRSINISRRS